MQRMNTVFGAAGLCTWDGAKKETDGFGSDIGSPFSLFKGLTGS